MMAAPMKKGRSKRRKLMPALFMAMISERLANCVVKKITAMKTNSGENMFEK